MKLLVAANDPGGANAIAPVVARLETSEEVLALLTGPARDTFARAGLAYEDASTLKIIDRAEAFAPDALLLGTSAGFEIEKKLIEHFNERVPSVSVLDFWNSYAERYSKEGTDLALLPTVICAPDEHARDGLIAVGVPAEKISVTGNPYFEHFADGVTRDEEEHDRMLFISQPISELGKTYGFDEFDALKDVSAIVAELVIRLHPREDIHKYDAFVSERIRISDEPHLERDLSRAGLVIGMFSPVLMQAAAAGKSVISYEPNLVGEDPLPSNRANTTLHAYQHTELEQLIARYKTEGSLPHEPFTDMTTGATEAVCQALRKVASK